MAPEPGSAYRLVVEGRDDKWTIIELLKRHGYDWDDDSVARPYVHDAGGIPKLLDMTAIATALKSYSRLGFVIDADLDLQDRWAQVKSCFASAGLALPISLTEGGIVLPASRPGTRVGIWLMPDNTQPGTLEHFLSKLVPARDTCWSHADQATTQARLHGGSLQGKDHLKGVIHAWLAWRNPPGLPFGTALTAKILGHESPEASRFVDWFHRLFVGP